MEVKYRKVTEKNIPLYLKIEKIGGSSGLYFSLKTVHEVKKFLAENTVYFICDGAKIIGTISYEIKNKDRVILTGIVVIPDYQKKGVATDAVKKILSEIENIKKIELVTHPKNIPAIKLYTRFGFRIVGRKENFFGDGQPRLLLERINQV